MSKDRLELDYIKNNFIMSLPLFFTSLWAFLSYFIVKTWSVAGLGCVLFYVYSFPSQASISSHKELIVIYICVAKKFPIYKFHWSTRDID